MKTKAEFYVISVDDYSSGPYENKQLVIDRAKALARDLDLETHEEEKYKIVALVSKVKARGKCDNEVWVEE